MKYYFPEDYDSFSCLKEECRHTCCASWEIDIDPDTWKLYQELPGPLGERVRSSVQRSGETVSFQLDEKGRCPMLTKDGLCSLILAYGEDVLCDICTDHPRYRNYFSDRVETGLGLCCEAAARQTVYRTKPYRLCLVADEDGGETLSVQEKEILSFREKLASVFNLQEVPYSDRERKALSLLPPFVMPSAEENGAFLQKLERLDREWESRLLLLGSAARLGGGDTWDRALGQLAVSFLYRHLPDAAEDGLLNARGLFALWSVRLIDGMTIQEDLDELAETARAYSAEIEYSEENLNACFAFLNSCFR